MTTTLPSWTSAEWADDVAEPFRSDRQFWSGLAAGADAMVTLTAAIAISVLLALTGHRLWAVAPFAVPVTLALRASIVSAASSRRSRQAFADRKQWQEAERKAVTTAFAKVLNRPRGVRQVNH